MTRPATPGSPHPAEGTAAHRGNGTRPISYAEPDLDEDETVNDALAATPGNGGVAVFQAPQPARDRSTAPATTPTVASPPPVDGPDIDSPFLDLFGGAMPPAPRAPSQPQPVGIPAALSAPPGPPPRPTGNRTAGGTDTPHTEPARTSAESPPRTDTGWAAHPAELPTWEPDELPEPAVRTRTPENGIGVPAMDPARRRIATAPPSQRVAPATGAPARRRIPEQPTHPPVTSEPHPSPPASDPYPEDRREARRTIDPPSPARPGPRQAEARPAGFAGDRGEPPTGFAPGRGDQPTGPDPRQDRPGQHGPDPADPGPHQQRNGSGPGQPREGAGSSKQKSGRSRRRESEPKPTQVRAPKVKFTDRDPAIELAITEIAGHLTFTPNTVTAWYWLPEVRWAFRPDAEREALLAAISEQYAGLAGFRLHLRRTTRPFPADEWARTVDAHTPHPLASVPGAASWSDHLVAAQRHLLSVNHAEGQTYLGVTFARRSLGNSLTERILRTFGRGVADGERRKLGRTVEQFDEVLGAFGMRGRRVTAGELEWLLYRSVALCMAPPGTLSPVTNGQWERGDLLALTEQVERYRSPYGSTVKLVNRMTGEERHVAVLAVGRMEPLEIPERHEPWLHFHERLPWPMELSTRVDILGSGDSFRNLEHRLRMIRSQQLDYAEHGIDAPPELERLAKRALVIGDEMTTGLPVDSARAHGWHRIAVGGRTREECLERARRLIQLYSRELRVSLQHPKNQDWLAREFIPGEPIANTGYIRRMPVNLLAAALPQAASTVGDRRGDLIGRTAGTCRRPVFLDLHFPMEVRERSGLAVFVAEPGGGKSTLLGALGYLAARRGVQVTLLDPSGPLARLCSMPELRPYSRVLNLTGSEQGTLAPYALIPTPLRSEFPSGAGGDREFEIAISNSRAERRMLVQDICMMLVPPQVAREASTATLLRHAVRQVPAEETSTLDDVVACLATLDNDEGKELANLLLDTAEMPLALLFFGRPPAGLLGADAALTVITMAGLRLPDLKIEREYWSAEEALALPMLHTAHRLAVRRCYGGSMGSRKMVGLDEAHFMEGWRSGRSFLVRLARDSRKWNLSALVASQNPRDILGLDVQNLVSTVFVGRIAEDTEIASEALRLLRVPVNDGYEATLASLSNVDSSSASRLGFREFVMRDVDGRVQKIRVDVSYVEGLLDHLDTTPASAASTPANLPISLADLEA
ncbi:ATP-binding protein [Micromonospora sp. NPDC050417]|uniref:ATP-binding protein n=1 Tax=Micromonospora sp. NPDC050417 TaxID=3364280 RepID=UPI0037BE1669